MIVIIVIFFNNFFIFYFLHFKKIYLDYKKQLMKDIEIFLKKKRKKAGREYYKNLSEN